MSPSTRNTRLLAAAQLTLFVGSMPPASAADRPLDYRVASHFPYLHSWKELNSAALPSGYRFSNV